MDGFASTTSLLTTLTQKNVKFEWSEPCQKSFQTMKDRLTTTKVLMLLEGSKGFVVYCDKSLVGLGCVFMQNEKVIAYVSRKIKVMRSTTQLMILS